jgi:hypothetical protein
MIQRRERPARSESTGVNRRRPRFAIDTSELLGTALAAFLIAGLLSATVGIASLLRAVEFGPMLGEILTFGPYDDPPPIWQIDATRSSDNRHCTLKPAIMAHAHGSMVVERRLPDGRTFQAHWIGGPTSDDNRDCGSAVDLTLRLIAMQTLVNADAQGKHWHFVGF